MNPINPDDPFVNFVLFVVKFFPGFGLYRSLHTKKIKGRESIRETRIGLHYRLTLEIIKGTMRKCEVIFERALSMPEKVAEEATALGLELL